MEHERRVIMADLITTQDLLEILETHPTNWLSQGASEEEIRDLERKLGVTLPPSYRELLSRTDGASLYEGKYIIFGTVSSEDRVQEGAADVRSRIQGLPPYLIPVGVSGNTVYCFDTTDPDNPEYPIVEWQPEEMMALPVSPSFPIWVKEQIVDKLDR